MCHSKVGDLQMMLARLWPGTRSCVVSTQSLAGIHKDSFCAVCLTGTTFVQLHEALEEVRQEGLAANEKLRQQEEASRAQLQALQSALTDAQVMHLEFFFWALGCLEGCLPAL